MMWYIIAGVLFCIAIGLLVWQYLRDRRYSKSKTSQTIGKKLWEEIQEERESSKERREKFKEALKKAEHGEESDKEGKSRFY